MTVVTNTIIFEKFKKLYGLKKMWNFEKDCDIKKAPGFEKFGVYFAKSNKTFPKTQCVKIRDKYISYTYRKL